MEEEKKYKDIELRSEEVQEVMNHIPPAILRYGIIVLLCIICTLFVGSAFFSYPDTVVTEFTLTTQNPPAYLVAKTTGRIERIYAGNKQSVQKGACIAVIENIAKTEDVFYLRERLNQWKQAGARTEQLDLLFFNYMPQLGSVQTAYSSCLLAWSNYLQHMQDSRTYGTELMNAIGQLTIAISEWEDKYLLISPVAGKLSFMQLWKENQNVTAGETMFVTVPEGNSFPVGKALLPMQGAGKVHIGQRAIVRLEGFSEQEFGFLEGKVVSISPVPDENGKFVVEVELINGLNTNYGKELPVMNVMTGTADIVTKEQSLLERLVKH